MNTLLGEGVMALLIGLLHMRFLRKAKARAQIKAVADAQQEAVSAA